MHALLLQSVRDYSITLGVQVSGLFFAIGHEPASKFVAGQLQTDADGYIITQPGTTQTSRPAIFACGDVQDKKWRQAITAAGTGTCALHLLLLPHALLGIRLTVLSWPACLSASALSL